MPKQPMAEVFGFPIDNFEAEAVRHRENRLCPYNNKVPNCTKDKAEDPLGVCSVYNHDSIAITCPVRFRERWLIAEHAADFFFPEGTKWTSLTEVKLKDKNGKSAGNIDIVVVAYDDDGKIVDFGSVEVQGVYISGTIRTAFQNYMDNPRADFDWSGRRNYPHADFLSSSRKRLAPQLIFKGGILHTWGKKQAVVLDTEFFATLPALEEVKKEEAELAWFVYSFPKSANENRHELTLVKTVYTKFEAAMETITKTSAGQIENFVTLLQTKLDEIGIAPNTSNALPLIE